MNTYILNIGLNTSLNYTATIEQLSIDQVLEAIQDSFLILENYKIEQSNTEQTVIATVEPMVGDCVITEIEILADLLMQDCIACYSVADQRGDLIGDYASEWGSFDSRYFLI